MPTVANQAVVSPASEKYARDLTERIRNATEGLYTLLLEAWESQAYKLLGYRSWSGYIDGEFDFNRAHSYRLINQAKVVQALRAGVSPIGDSFEPIHVSEYEARNIAPAIEVVTERVREQVAAGVAPREAVVVAIEEIRRPSMPQPFEERAEHEHEFVCRICGERA